MRKTIRLRSSKIFIVVVLVRSETSSGWTLVISGIDGLSIHVLSLVVILVTKKPTMVTAYPEDYDCGCPGKKYLLVIGVGKIRR